MNHDILRDHPEKWKEAVVGYETVTSFQELAENLGSNVRYLTRETVNGTSGKLEMRLGGILTYADPKERYISLKNPRANGGVATWSVQTHQHRNGNPVINYWDSDQVKKYKRVTSKENYTEVVFWIRKHMTQEQEVVCQDIMDKLKSGQYRIIKNQQ